jgi:hypothetical protein
MAQDLRQSVWAAYSEAAVHPERAQGQHSLPASPASPARAMATGIPCCDTAEEQVSRR